MDKLVRADGVVALLLHSLPIGIFDQCPAKISHESPGRMVCGKKRFNIRQIPKDFVAGRGPQAEIREAHRDWNEGAHQQERKRFWRCCRRNHRVDLRKLGRWVGRRARDYRLRARDEFVGVGLTHEDGKFRRTGEIVGQQDCRHRQKGL